VATLNCRIRGAATATPDTPPLDEGQLKARGTTRPNEVYANAAADGLFRSGRARPWSLDPVPVALR
jgi:hypothetical protein